MTDDPRNERQLAAIKCAVRRLAEHRAANSTMWALHPGHGTRQVRGARCRSLAHALRPDHRDLVPAADRRAGGGDRAGGRGKFVYLAGVSLSFSRGTARIYQTLASKTARRPPPLPPTRADPYR